MLNTLPAAVTSTRTVEVTETHEEQVITLTLTVGDAARVYNALGRPYRTHTLTLRLQGSGNRTLGESLDEVRRALDDAIRASGSSPREDLQR